MKSFILFGMASHYGADTSDSLFEKLPNSDKGRLSDMNFRSQGPVADRRLLQKYKAGFSSQ